MIKIFGKKIDLLPILIFILTLGVYYLTSAGKTPYDYFTRLAASFLKGKYYLTQNPSWLSELIPVGEKMFYVVYPPMPAILSMPFVALFKANFQQQYLAHLLGAGVGLLIYKLSLTLNKNRKNAFWVLLLTSFGTIIWFLASTGSSWYLGQITATFFLTAALVESFNKKRAFRVGLFLGAAYLSRVNVAISFPFFIFFIDSKNNLKKIFRLVLGILPFILFNFYYNFIRFGTIFDKGYFLLPEVLNETQMPWFKYGLVSPLYIPEHLKTIFLATPKIISEFPYIIPSLAGLAIWITTPAFFYSIFTPVKNKFTKIAWLAILSISLIIFMHGGTGWSQFGYRFAVDFYPFLILLTIGSIKKTGLKWHHWLVLTISVIINLWGVIFINKFGWFKF